MKIMEFTFKKIVAPFVLASFLMVVFFGFAAMSSGPDGRMQGDCPFSATGVSLCPQNTLAVALHHLSSYHSFISVPLYSTLLTLVSALLLITLFILIPPVRLLSLQPLIHSKYSNHSPPISARTWNITRWLSLLENSPSLR